MRWPALLVLAALGLLSWGVFGGWTEPRVEQPIQFPHKTHVELNLECTSCHDRAEKDAVAGRPRAALCLGCHGGGDATGEIKKVQDLGGRGEIPWKRVWRLPSHVFFSHRIHVTVAQVKCQTCHGPMETLDRPPPRPLKTLAMNDCIACHERSAPRVEPPTAPAIEKAAERRAGPARPRSTDCNACHR